MNASPPLLTFLTFFGTLAAMATIWFLLRSARTASRDRNAAPSATARALAVLARPEEEQLQDALALEMVQAGLRDPNTLPIWLASRVTLAILLPIPAWLVFRPADFFSGALVVLLAVGLGYFVPASWLSSRRRDRQREITRALPSLLDLLVSCLEAGLSLDASIAHTAREIRTTSPALADELEQLQGQVAAGIDRQEALADLARRTGVREVDALVHLLGRLVGGGSGIAHALRQHSQLVRRTFSLVAEQKASSAGPTLTVVMIVFIMPAFVVILVGPTALDVIEHVLPTLLR